MKDIAVRFTDKDYEKIQEEAKKEGLPIAAYIRRIVLLKNKESDNS